MHSLFQSVQYYLRDYRYSFAKLSFFGLYGGLIVSVIGEAIGTISFLLYRKELKKLRLKESQHSILINLKTFEEKNAFWVILILRIMPFIPSGVVTELLIPKFHLAYLLYQVQLEKYHLY